jgi:superfamily II DNA or RNA helicase
LALLEDLTTGAIVGGVRPNEHVTILAVQWHGADVINITYRCSDGRVEDNLRFRSDQDSLSIIEAQSLWNFDADGDDFKLATEAKRISLAHLFDPRLAVHTSIVEPLPHQIIAVYEEMLARQPLRFLLADDPGAGKTIMAGLFIKELHARSDVRRCLICAPGSLSEQWQDELSDKFNLNFDIITRQHFEESRSGNPFLERNLIIARLDHLSRNDEVLAKLEQSEWDLVVVDEAHKMSAHFDPDGEVSKTKRYKLGELLSGIARHYLLMTATPHNGHDEDFQLFLKLLDADRFEGRPRGGRQRVDASDLMRRMVKEELRRFDGTKLFPERIASTLPFALSDQEVALYTAVTDYVREQWQLADQIGQDGDKRRRSIVGFALTTLQRRLASSPEAIYRSLQRRRERLEKNLREAELLKRGTDTLIEIDPELAPFDPDQLDDDFDDEVPAPELEEAESDIVNKASAARTISELRTEIQILRQLEQLAFLVRESEQDRKWEELRNLLQGEARLFQRSGHKHKLIIFTEHRDTLFYLQKRITNLMGNPASVDVIYGQIARDQRRKIQQRFQTDEELLILIATDAAGEGVNLQRAHLMVNYDLPWNPNRLEQRFGRIHRIGQTEICHLWNLVAENTREGEVFRRLFEKLERERESLGGKVFDVLGQVFTDRSLRDMLIDAIRSGGAPVIEEKIADEVDQAMAHDRLRHLIEDQALAHEALDVSRVMAIGEEMERFNALRLQPHFIQSFFMEAFKRLGGSIREREPGRFQITNVPSVIRQRDRRMGRGDIVLSTYERVTFEKHLIHVAGKPSPAEFICPGNPLLDAVIDLVLERHRTVLKQGAVLVDPQDWGTDPRLLIGLEHALNDGKGLVLSKQLQFAEIDQHNQVHNAGPAPYLDYDVLPEPDSHRYRDLIQQSWISEVAASRDGVEKLAMGWAAGQLASKHLMEVKDRRIAMVAKTRQAVQERLQSEINYWDHRATELREREQAGKAANFRLNSARARARADELATRLADRLAKLDDEKIVQASLPVVIGAALILPIGLISPRETTRPDQETIDRVDRLAIAAVMASERALGHEPTELHHNHPGYDIESKGRDGHLRFIEVKGKTDGVDTVTVSANQVLVAMNEPEKFIFAVVPISGEGQAGEPRYVRRPFGMRPDTGVRSVTYHLADLLAKGGPPS